MKAKEIKPLCSWEERRPIVHDKMLYIPPYYQEHNRFSFPGFDQLFDNQKPIALEYCSGNGSWIIEKALQEPNYNWVAVEKRFDRVRKIFAKAKNRHLDNLFVVWGEALTFTRYYLIKHSVDRLFINFPDPWPKNGAAKHRLLSADFLEELARVMKEGAEALFVTDETLYHEKTRALFLKSGNFYSAFPEPYYTSSLPGYGSSFFENLWRSKGKTIYYQKWISVSTRV